MQTLQQVVDERISFLKEQINPHNKPQENKTLQLQIDAIRSATAAPDITKSLHSRIVTLRDFIKLVHFRREASPSTCDI
jgi:hypothetical protein